MADLAMDVWLWAHDEYSSAFRQFGAAAEGMHSKIGLLAHGVGLLADGMGSLAGGILGDAVKEAAQYESVTQGMANNTNMTKAQLDDMRTASIALSEQTGQDAERIAEGWMHISNHLYEGAAAYNIASAAAKNAAATNGNVADDANILAGVLREYNVQAKDLARNNELATRYMDTLHNAVANSNWTNITSFFGGVERHLWGLAGLLEHHRHVAAQQVDGHHHGCGQCLERYHQLLWRCVGRHPHRMGGLLDQPRHAAPRVVDGHHRRRGQGVGRCQRLLRGCVGHHS